MRPVTSESKGQGRKGGGEGRGGESLRSLHKVKKASELQTLRNQLIVERTSRMSMKELGKGRLHLGSMSKPVLVLRKEERMNPWAKPTTISEQVLNQKGLLNLLHMGVIAKQTDCHQLLNNRYDIIQKHPQPTPTPSPSPFMTHPLIVDAYYELTKKKQQEEERQEEERQKDKGRGEKAIRRRSSTKKVVVGNEERRVDFIKEDPIRLSILNFHVQSNEDYMRLLRKSRREGLDHVLRVYIGKIEQFTAKYGLKKVTVVPCLDETRRTSERVMLESIVNYRVLGVGLRVKGRGVEMLRWLLLSKLARMRYAQVERAIKRIERVKNTFKIKKLYRQMMGKRWQFLHFKLASFAENQRRLVADNIDRAFRPEVEIHLLGSEVAGVDLNTYYKWQERKKAQLTRLYSNEPDHIVLLLSHQEDLTALVQHIETLPSSWKKPKIHLFYLTLAHSNLQECADTYFALTPQHIQAIRRICDGRNTVLVPYHISPFLPHLCETLGVRLFAGTFTDQSRALLQEEIVGEEGVGEVGGRRSSHDLNTLYSRRLREVTLANAFYQSKYRAKELFVSVKVATPQWVGLGGKKQEEFFRELVHMMLMGKCSKWVLKLPRSTFSRGLGVLETESLKIIKEAKKRGSVREEDVEEIMRIIESILVQKVALPQSSLMAGEEFVGLFKAQQGYVEAFLEGCQPVAIFGRIELNGVFTLLGTYRKYYAEGVCLGAMYPAKEVGEEAIRMVERLASRLYQQGVFGYLTFELLFSERNRQFYFIDLLPHLDSYSSFYFYYRRLLDITELDAARFNNTLKRTLFYAPFIDNNANRFPSPHHLDQALADNKSCFDPATIEGFKYLYTGEGEPKVVSLVCFGQDEAGAVRLCLEGLRFLVEKGGEFNKFDKKYKKGQTDALYIMDIIWKMRQVRKEVADK